MKLDIAEAGLLQRRRDTFRALSQVLPSSIEEDTEQ